MSTSPARSNLVVTKALISQEQAVNAIELQRNAILLRFAARGPNCFLWVLVDPDQSVERRVFKVVADDMLEVPRGAKYVDSVDLKGGQQSFHLFEITGLPEAMGG